MIAMTQTNPTSNKILPSSMAQIGITTKYTLLDYLRSKRYLAIFIITFFISVLLTIVIAYERPANIIGKPLDFYGGWWNGVVILIVLSGILFGGDAISNEFQSKTGYFTVPNPVRRSSVYIGKFIAAYAAASSIIAIFAVIGLGNGLVYLGFNVPVQFVESLLFSLFYLAAILGFSFFFSALFKSSAMSIIINAIFVLFVFSLIQGLVTGLVKIEPWFILTYAQTIIINIFTTPFPAHAVTAGGMTMYTATVSEGLAIIGLYFAVTTVLGLLLFERKEFN